MREGAARSFDGGSCREPISGDVVVGIRETGAGLAGNGRLSTSSVGIPGGVRDSLQLNLQGRKGRVDES
jgi:hypothetical protein